MGLREGNALNLNQPQKSIFEIILSCTYKNNFAKEFTAIGSRQPSQT